MASYTLNIRVDPSILPTFTEDRSLVLYKKVNDRYKVVTQSLPAESLSSLAEGTKVLQWKEEYAAATAPTPAPPSVKVESNMFGSQGMFSAAPFYNSSFERGDMIEFKLRGDAISIGPADSSKVAEWKEPAGPARSNADPKPRDQYILFWKNHISADPGDESEGYGIVFEEAETTKSVRFGFKDPNKPRQDGDVETLTFYPVD